MDQSNSHFIHDLPSVYHITLANKKIKFWLCSKLIQVSNCHDVLVIGYSYSTRASRVMKQIDKRQTIKIKNSFETKRPKTFFLLAGTTLRAYFNSELVNPITWPYFNSELVNLIKCQGRPNIYFKFVFYQSQQLTKKIKKKIKSTKGIIQKETCH